MIPRGPDPGWRTLGPQVTAALTRRYRDFAAAEDAVQEALVAAWRAWDRDPPRDPGAWLYRTAERRLLDLGRSERARARREQDWSRDREPGGTPSRDLLDLLLLCCHPRLAPSAAVALTLRAVMGLTNGEIGAAFFVPMKTAAQRVARAKEALAPLQPDTEISESDQNARLPAVRRVLYLVFNEGYSRSQGDELVGRELVGVALNWTRALDARYPGHPETRGLLALMLLNAARIAARTGPSGELVPLEQQDRTLWDREQIAEGVRILDPVVPVAPPGPYRVQAAIAALHAEAADVASTDWPQIAALYTVLARLEPNPMTDLNLVVARGHAQGVDAAQAELEERQLDRTLAGHHRLDLVKGWLALRRGDAGAAAVFYLRAAGKTASLPEKAYLQRKAQQIEAGEGEGQMGPSGLFQERRFP